MSKTQCEGCFSHDNIRYVEQIDSNFKNRYDLCKRCRDNLTKGSYWKFKYLTQYERVKDKGVIK